MSAASTNHGPSAVAAVAILDPQIGPVPILQIIADRIVVGDAVARDVSPWLPARDTCLAGRPMTTASSHS